MMRWFGTFAAAVIFVAGPFYAAGSEHGDSGSVEKPDAAVADSPFPAAVSVSDIPEEKKPSWVVDPNLLAENKEDMQPEVIRAHRQMKGPRQLLTFFLNAAYEKDYKSAALALDFSKHPELSEQERENYAFKLAGILFRLENFSLDAIPTDYDEDHIGIWPDHEYKALVLDKQKTGTWRFSPETVADTPRLYARIESSPPIYIHSAWMKKLPRWVFTECGHLTLFQWAKLIAFIFLGWVLYRICPWVVSHLTMFFFHSDSREVYTKALTRSLRPLAYLGMLWGWFAGLRYVQVAPPILDILLKILEPLCILTVTISLLRFVGILAIWLREKKWGRDQVRMQPVWIDFLSGTIKLLIACSAAVATAEVFGFSAIGIVSGMGIGGIAVALAAQQTLSNVFASLSILVDRPFKAGDHVIVNGIDGFVESVGIRSTCIRTLYDSRVFVPNGQLLTSVIDNMGRRTAWRMILNMGLQYDTPVVLLRAFCAGVKSILLEHPKVRKDVRVNVSDLSESSIDIKLVCFLVVKDTATEAAVRETLILQIVEFAEKLGVSFAFPTRVNYMIDSQELAYPQSKGIQKPEQAEELGEQLAASVLWPELEEDNTTYVMKKE